MSVLIVFVAIALCGLCAWLLLQLSRMQRQVAALHQQLGTAPALPPAAAGQSRIAIEILNPFELAARETRFASAAAKLAPRMIERIVYERAAVMIAQQMADQGVRAEVTTHVG